MTERGKVLVVAMALLALVGGPTGSVAHADGDASRAASVRLAMPYRSQLDGSRYGPANCGPTSLSMVLAYYGIDASPWDVRVRAMIEQDSWVDSEGGYSDDYGVFVQHLAAVAEHSYGLHTYGLWQPEGGRKVDRLRRWDVADVRNALLAGRPVVVLVQYRSLPGRSHSPYTEDHYVVVHGVSEDGARFVYSDPMDRNGGGPSLEITGERLGQAMSNAGSPGAAFAVYR